MQHSSLQAEKIQSSSKWHQRGEPTALTSCLLPSPNPYSFWQKCLSFVSWTARQLFRGQSHDSQGSAFLSLLFNSEIGKHYNLHGADPYINLAVPQHHVHVCSGYKWHDAAEILMTAICKGTWQWRLVFLFRSQAFHSQHCEFSSILTHLFGHQGPTPAWDTLLREEDRQICGQTSFPWSTYQPPFPSSSALTVFSQVTMKTSQCSLAWWRLRGKRSKGIQRTMLLTPSRLIWPRWRTMLRTLRAIYWTGYCGLAPIVCDNELEASYCERLPACVQQPLKACINLKTS